MTSVQRYAGLVIAEIVCLLSAFTFEVTSAFITSSRRTAFSRAINTPLQRNDIFQRHMIDSHSIWTAVEVFDGSSIVDPVVVSGAFWAGLKGKLLSVIIGQFLATIVFGLIASFVAKQVSSFGSAVSKTVSSAMGGSSASKAAGPNSSTSPRKEVSPDFGKLLVCLLIDFAGSSSEVIPLLGDLTDVAFAPIAATALRSLFGGSNIVFGLEFLEEILPLTDILPLATICWVVETYYYDSDIARLLQVGDFDMKKDAIDVSAQVDRQDIPKLFGKDSDRKL